MNRLFSEKPITHAIVWIVLYIVLVNIGDALLEFTHIPNLATAILLSILSLVLLRYTKNKVEIGLQMVTGPVAKHVWYYVPLLVLVIISYRSGFDESLGIPDVLAAIALMVNVGFIEELLFRGYLLKAIAHEDGQRKAVIISGITFGIGHIVNLLRGYSVQDQISQIVVAIAIGLVLASLVIITKSLFVGILFHILFNIGGTITTEQSNNQIILLIALLVVTLPYLVALLRKLPKSEH